MAEDLRLKLKLAQFRTHREFRKKYKKADKYLRKKGIKLGEARAHSAKIIAGGALATGLLLSPVEHKALPSPHGGLLARAGDNETLPAVTPKIELANILAKVLPAKPRPLGRDEEAELERAFSEIIGVPAKAELDGQHLNTTYGLIGAEQHLRRYPGDTLANHGEGDVLAEGIAPGLGAWGYFAPAKGNLTPELENIERWYTVVQTLYLPDWETNLSYLRDWYKYRKVLMVNTENAKAVVASIADSGPAMFTGKSFGASPEVMDYLGGPRYKKGPVVVFFIDDKNNSVPLGPVRYNTVTVPGAGVRNLDR